MPAAPGPGEPQPHPSPAPPPYPSVEPQPRFPAIEEEVLAYWKADGTFEASVSGRPGGENEYVFYDGPPFANGLPHYGHLLTGFVKDAVPRYQTMRGRRVERRFGWDCHGLPAEMDAERELGVSGRAAITGYGIERFNAHCRASVLRYAHEWERYVSRQARWVDFEHDYKTLDLDYMESVLWAFKALHGRGLVHEGYRVLPYCWECETPLSNFETRMDDSYRQRQDPAVTVRFALDPVEGEAGTTWLLAWTTTPWTLPSNLVLAVGPDIEYALYEQDGDRWAVAAARAPAYASDLPGGAPVATVRGAELVGRTYRPLFGFFAGHPGAFRVLAADFVTTDEGTGIVQIAPGFGEDDQRLCEANGVALVVPVDDRGRFTAEVPPYEGLQVFDANARVIDDLRASGALVRRDSYLHAYPHCWRSDTPLIYRAMSSWFVSVTAFRDRMVELNREIRWVPGWVGDSAFARWLEHARDWSISRNRFWGTPIPVWKSDDPRYPRVDVYGSLDEMERDFGVRPTDLHRPAVDLLTRPNPDDPSGASTMRRVDDVLDCWFESGSMPYAQVHYPFENREWFESHFPADFIVEYVGQTRGWFYTLHVLATALFDKPPFRTCVAHGVVLGDDGQKASKRLRNYPDPDEVFGTLGADAMRWSLLSSPVLRGGDLVVDRRLIIDAQRSVLAPLWNAWNFFTRFANAEGYRARLRTDATGVLDRYVLAKGAGLVAEVTASMEGDDLSGACTAVEAFLDALCNWYIRRSRPRFWGTGDEGASPDAFDTLATVLEVLCRVAAPLLPLVTEQVWRGLVAGGRSVHLCDWPDAEELPADPALVEAMDRVREVCSAAHSVRETAGLHVRLPLASLTVAAPGSAELSPFADLIAAEVNVKTVKFAGEVGDAAELVLSVNPRVAGPRLGADVQKVIAAVKAGSWEAQGDGTVVAAGIALEPAEFDLRLKPTDPATTRGLAGQAGVVVLDTVVTPELAAEGLARDVTRLVQRARRDAGLEVTDRIRLVLDIAADEVRAAVQRHQGLLAEQTLAVEVDYARLAQGHRGVLPDGRAVHIGLTALG